jgi:MFS family permease
MMYLQQVRDRDPLTAGLVFLGPSLGAALGGVPAGRLAASRAPVLAMGLTTVVAAVSLAALAASRTWVCYLPALTACGLTLGPVYAFTTAATQAVVRTERAGEGAGVTLTALVTMAGVGVAVSGTVLEMLQRAGMSPAGAVDAIVAVLAPLLLPAGVVVLLIARASKSGA